MARLMTLMGTLVAVLSACGPPDPGMMANESAEAGFNDPRGDMDNSDMDEVPQGF